MRVAESAKIDGGLHAPDWSVGLSPIMGAASERAECDAQLSASTHAVAKLYWAEHGGPIRTIIDGRKTRPTGTFLSVKGGGRSMPWESKLERAAMRLADLSSRVDFLLAQPHRLEISVRGNGGKPLIYFPDLLLRAHPSFLHDLRSGVPFAEAALMTCSVRVRPHLLKALIVEVKADEDSRYSDPRYAAKLELAKEIYERRGFEFITIVESLHLHRRMSELARLPDLHKDTTLDARDYQCCLTCFGGTDTQPAKTLIKALGEGPAGFARLVALHYRGFISVDFSSPPDSRIAHLTRDGGRRS